MAVPGVYSAEEEKLIEEWKSKTFEWMKDEATLDFPYPVSHRVVTKDRIIANANGMGDDNPLYRDEAYARNTRWGGIIAPPLYPFAICNFGPVTNLNVPKSVGNYRECTAGYKCEFFKPIRVGDSFKVINGVSRTMEDKTKPDGTGYRHFLFTYDKRYINQDDEVVCTIHSKRFAIINPPEVKKFDQPILPLLNMYEYKYTQEEVDYIDRITDEEEIRGADTRYWEDVNIGDELKPVAFGPVTIWDQMIEFAGRALLFSGMRQIRKKTPQTIMVDPVTNIRHKSAELHFVDRTAELMGGTIAVISRAMLEQSLCRLITNWMGDDGFLKKFDSHDWHIVPIGDAFFCKGKVVNKRIENGEHLVDFVVWSEDIRGFMPSYATATVSLYSKHED